MVEIIDYDDWDDPDSVTQSFASEEEAERYGKRVAALTVSLEQIFAKHRVPPSSWGLQRVAALSHSFHISALTQETGLARKGRPDTRKPVEQLRDAIDKVLECYAECERVAGVEPPPGRLNVSRRFIDDARRAHDFRFPMTLLRGAADWALKTGKLPEKKRAVARL
jgi:hypothetical protein